MSSRYAPRGAVLAVVHEPGTPPPGGPLVLELCGPLGPADAESVAARLAQRHRAFDVALDSHRPGRHTLRLTPPAGAPGPVPLPAELLADVLAPPPPGGEVLPVTGHQQTLLIAALAPAADHTDHIDHTGPTDHTGPANGTDSTGGTDGWGSTGVGDGTGGAGGGDGQLEQLYWDWSGPLDVARFAAAWQSVVDRESVLRACFDWVASPRLVLHARADADIAVHSRTAVTWARLLRRDRARGFALHRPGLLRLALLRGASSAAVPAPPPRVLLTYHPALLDERGVHLLLREFYRAYAAGGVLPGGERRPDLRDHARWLAGQNTDAARQLWARAAPPRHAATRPGRPGGETGQHGPGLLHTRLRAAQTFRLRSWAALRGVAESSALHLVWALLLYRAADAQGPLPVSFGVQLSGRDIALPGAAGIPGPLDGPLPMTVTVDPDEPLTNLLHQVRDTLLDLAAYPWAGAESIRAWSGRPPSPPPSPAPAVSGSASASASGSGSGLFADTFTDPCADTLVRFEGPLLLPQALRGELAAQGIDVQSPRTAAGATGRPLTLTARHDTGGGLALTAVYDRARLADEDAAALHAQCVRLLGALPGHRDAAATAGQLLDVLARAAVPRMARPAPPPPRPVLSVLRPGHPHADVICLVVVPGVPRGGYDLFVRGHRGPEKIVAVHADGAPGAPQAVLHQARGPGRRLVLCGCGPGGRAAYELAQHMPYASGPAPAVVMTGIGDAAASASALARGVRAVLTPPP
ncbi:condensation domain-containing protein [Streptomyces sp. NPDC002769]|uniref:condensation domain-containing protein n=1 Tax=Streptomyces sp. NPDC002769 TaxID=3154542 RepID=UPI003324EB48